MAVADSPSQDRTASQNRAFLDGLARSESARLLERALDRRWPATPDRLPAMARHALLPAGKMLRPLMMLHAAEAVGGTPADLVAAALGLEYLHVATLVHDDIIDHDDTRRGRPSVPAAFGVPDAIVAGDHLIFSAFSALLDEPWAATSARVAAAVATLAEAGSDLCRGQIMEARIVGDLEAASRWYPEMVRLKTGALFRAACQIGAILGGADMDVANSLAAYGEQLGVAFQMRDDLLAYVATAEEAGKPATSDLGNGRPTMPLLLAYEAAGESQRAELAAVLARQARQPGDVAWVAALVAETGAVAAARDRMAGHIGKAREGLSALPPSPSAEVLDGIACWTVGAAR